jgi:methyltransferase
VALERLLELWVSSRNTRRLLELGGTEVAGGHYPAMVAFHVGLLFGCAVEPVLFGVPWPRWVSLAAALLVLGAEGLRWWAVSALRGRWTTRVIVLPGAPHLREGPYRYLRHPNYLAVAVEVLALPLACGAWRTAIAALFGNALLLAVRIRAEERALGEAWEEEFRGVPRFWPFAKTRTGRGRA